MLICKNCGARLADHSKKCYACGTPVTPDTVEGIPKDEAEMPEGRNVWQEKYGAGKEKIEKTKPDDSGFQNPFDTDFDTDNDPFMNWSESDIFRKLQEEQQKVYKAPTDEQLLIGNGAFEYTLKFARLRDRGTMISWNWWAFLIGPTWFIYRKMYFLGSVLLALGMLGAVTIKSMGYYYAITFLIDVLMGMFGDSLYMARIERLEKHIPKDDSEKKNAYIRHHGGTSVAGVVIAFIVYEIIVILLGR